jgi:hypothetical protein
MPVAGDSLRRVSYRLEEVAAMTGLPVKRLRTEAALGNLKITKLGPRTSLVLAADLEAFLDRARRRSE